MFLREEYYSKAWARQACYSRRCSLPALCMFFRTDEDDDDDDESDPITDPR